MMKKSFVLGAVVGFAAGTALAVTGMLAVNRVAKEIKTEMGEQCFASPNEEHFVTVSYGSSKTAKGLTLVRVNATSVWNEDSCKLVLFTRKMPETLETQWLDDHHFRLLIGNGKRKQCCDVSFDEKLINAKYYLTKTALE